jgi:hypothetical protein
MNADKIPIIPDEHTSDHEDAWTFQEVGWGVAAWQAEVRAIVSQALNQQSR